MDISALSEHNFDAADWINANYREYVAQEQNKEIRNEKADKENAKALGFINTYVAKLQLYVQQVNYAIEDTSQQLVSSMPRIAQEARNLQKNVKELKERMHEVHAEVAAVQSETGDCMSTLEQLNMLQIQLQTAKETLQQSDGWGNLINEIEDSFERNDLKSVCEKLLALQKSLAAQQQLAGHADRLTQTEDFKNRMEALASPRLVKCFAENDLEEAQNYVGIFKDIGRLTQLQQYYRAVHKTNLQQEWKEILELNAVTDQQTKQVFQEQQQQNNRFLILFYDELLEFCQRQIKWCINVFGLESVEQPFMVIMELLPALEPLRDTHIMQLMKSSNERLELLQQYAQANHLLVRQLNALISQLEVKLSAELQERLAVAIYEYFHKFIQQYARLEETELSTQIDRLIVNQTSIGEALRHLEHSNQKVFDWLNAAFERCALITNDLALCKLIALLSGVFKRLLETYNKTQRQLCLSTRGQTEEWSLLQYSMSLLQYLAEFQQRLQQFEQLLQTRLEALLKQISNNKHLNELSIYQTIEQKQLQQLQQDIDKFQHQLSEADGIFESIHSTTRTQFIEIHDLALNILLWPVEAQLRQLHNNANSFSSVVDLPAFSLAPQEYITQIGQYLLMLPQHLEPLLLTPSVLLKQALEQCHVRYTPNIPCADVLLALVVDQCCSLYCAQILQIQTLTPAASKQLIVDIEYLSNVTEELGGLTLSTHLSQILTLLQAPSEQYLALSSGCEPKLVTAIRQMRNILSTQ